MTNKKPEEKFDEWLGGVIENHFDSKNYHVGKYKLQELINMRELTQAIRKALDIKVVDKPEWVVVDFEVAAGCQITDTPLRVKKDNGELVYEMFTGSIYKPVINIDKFRK
jgi:hypothetical protein